MARLKIDEPRLLMKVPRSSTVSVEGITTLLAVMLTGMTISLHVGPDRCSITALWPRTTKHRIDVA